MTTYSSASSSSSPVDRDTWSLMDSYVLSQDISVIQEEARVLGYLNRSIETTVPLVDVNAHPGDYLTITGVMDAVSEGVQSHGARREPLPRWTWMLIGIGVFMAVLGLGLANPIAQVVWSMLHKGS